MKVTQTEIVNVAGKRAVFKAYTDGSYSVEMSTDLGPLKHSMSASKAKDVSFDTYVGYKTAEFMNRFSAGYLGDRKTGERKFGLKESV